MTKIFTVVKFAKIINVYQRTDTVGGEIRKYILAYVGMKLQT
jgi:hypothetical protein